MKKIDKLISKSKNARTIADIIQVAHIKISTLESEIEELNVQLKESILTNSNFSRVEKLAVYLNLKRYPTNLYDVCGMDSGEWDFFGDIEIKVCWGYDYTDVMGLSEEEFKELIDIMKREEA